MLNVIRGIYGFRKGSELVYIGSSINILRRKTQHLYYLKKQKHHSEKLQHAYNKYGEDAFVFEVIEITDDLLEREQYYLDLYKPRYNVHMFADRREFSDEIKAKISKSSKSKQMLTLRGTTRDPEIVRRTKETMAARKAAGIKRKRKPMSEETKEKIRNAQKGIPREYARRPCSEETKAKIAQRLLGNTNGAKKTH